MPGRDDDDGYRGAFDGLADGASTRVSSVAQLHDLELQLDQACLFAIHSRSAGLLGKRVELAEGTLTIGRSEANDVVVPDDAVSRRHARIVRKHRASFVVDEGSTNGTYVNRERVTGPQEVRDGDTIKIGGTVFKHLCGNEVEARYHEEIYKLTILDGLTGAHNNRYLLEDLERKLARARRDGTALSMLVLDVDDFEKIVDGFGRMATDELLVQLSALIRAKIPDGATLVRRAEQQFAIVLGLSFEASRDVARELVDAAARQVFPFDSEKMRITVRVGCASLAPEHADPAALLAAADDAAYGAKRRGGSCVYPDAQPDLEARPSRKVRRVLDGPLLLGKLLDADVPGVLAGLEIDDEANAVQSLGTRGFQEWFRELLQDAENAIPERAHLGSWRDRYVLIGMTGEDAAGEITGLVERIAAAWMARPVDAAHRARLMRDVRTAVLPSERLRAADRAALDALLVELVRERAASVPSGAALPFPLAVLHAMIPSRRTRFARVKTMLDAVETSVRFLVAAQLAALRKSDEATVLNAASSLAKDVRLNQPLSMGAWVTLAWRLGALLPDSAAPELLSVRRHLVRAGSAPPAASDLMQEILQAVRARNQMLHGVMNDEEAYQAHEATLGKLSSALLTTLAPLGSMELVSVAEIHEIDEDDVGTYDVYLHQGPVEYFPIARREVKARLGKGWCHLLTPSGDALALSPLFAASVCDACGRLEVCLSDLITLGPKGAKSKVRGLTSGHVTELEVAWNRSAQRLYEGWAAHKETKR